MIKLVTDTAAGLSRDLAAQLDVDLISQVVMFGADTLRDGVDITNEVFLQRLKTSKEFPKTSQPPPGDFAASFKRHLDAGHEVLCVTISSLLSGTYNSAETAKKQVDSDRVKLVDTKSVATGQALIVMEASRLIKAGKPMNEIVDRLNHMAEATHFDFTLDTVEYLVKGGRATRAQGFLGTLLNIKPILTIKEGRVEPLERVRTKAKAVARMCDIVDETVRGKPGIQLCVTHTGLPGEAGALAEKLRAAYSLNECRVIEMPPAVAAHAGPGALGVAYYTE